MNSESEHAATQRKIAAAYAAALVAKQQRIENAKKRIARHLRKAAKHVANLEACGFGDPDADTSGADTVDTVNAHWTAIKAAPELLTALQFARNALNDIFDLEPDNENLLKAIDVADEAIRKATGETP